MPRTSEIRFPLGRLTSCSALSQPATRQRAIVRRNSRRDLLAGGVYGDCVGCSLGVFVLDYHLREVEGLRAAGEERGAQVAAGVADQEGGFGGGEGAGGDYQVAFVFAGFGVEDDDGVAAG